MTATEKIEWAKRALEEIAQDCDELARLPVVDPCEARTWRSVAAKARRAVTVLAQTGEDVMDANYFDDHARENVRQRTG